MPHATWSVADNCVRHPLQLKKFNSHRPKWVDPKTYLDAQFQNLFELSFYADNDQILSTGWNVQIDTVYPGIGSRAPEQFGAAEDMESPSTWSNDAGSDNESSNEEVGQQAIEAVTRMVDESSDDDVIQFKVY